MIHIDRGRVKVPLKYQRIQKRAQPIVSLKKQWSRDLWQDARKMIQPALHELFHGKCAYCESPINGVSRGEIDHFRPRINAQGLDADDVNPKHYLWLGYTWENLYLSCSACNRHKRNLFPVIGRRAEPGVTGTKLYTEDSLLLDPCRDEPADCLEFGIGGKIKPLDERGEVTIRILGLNRSELVRMRAEIRGVCEKIASRALSLASGKGPPKELLELLNRLADMCADKAPHAAVARAVWAKLSSHKQIKLHLEKSETPLSAHASESPDLASRPIPRTTTRPAKKKPVKKKRSAKKRQQIMRKAEMLEAVWIDTIDIKNFRCIRECTLGFLGQEELSADAMETAEDSADDLNRQPWLMLIGRNGVGKSSILKAVGLALLSPAKRNELFPDAAACVNRDAIAERKKNRVRGKVTGRISLAFTNGDILTIRFQEGSKTFSVEGKRPRSFQAVGYSSTRLPSGSGRSPPKLSPRVVMQNLFNPFVPLSDVNRWLADTSQLQSTPFKVLAEGVADLLSIPPDSNAISRRNKKLYMKGIAFDELSDGYRSLASLATDLMRRLSVGGLSARNFVGTVLLDEIETHLHPEWKLIVVDTLRRVFPNVRFLVATHDPLCLRGLGPGEVHRLYFDAAENRTVLRRLDVPPGLDMDELLTGSWFGLSSTLDRDTRELFDKHRQLIRSRQTTKVKTETREVRNKLRKRLYGTPNESSVERMVNDLVSTELDSQIEEFTPQDRKALHGKLQDRLAKARNSKR